jgi:hypothetical protein
VLIEQWGAEHGGIGIHLVEPKRRLRLLGVAVIAAVERRETAVAVRGAP